MEIRETKIVNLCGIQYCMTRDSEYSVMFFSKGDCKFCMKKEGPLWLFTNEFSEPTPACHIVVAHKLCLKEVGLEAAIIKDK